MLPSGEPRKTSKVTLILGEKGSKKGGDILVAELEETGQNIPRRILNIIRKKKKKVDPKPCLGRFTLVDRK